ncbi:alpha/beta hydrolase [Mycobacterium sp. CVI_P3]|uniref:Alpha/beta hydrolase n=1 Tax=Mycobacterium pinniadriaticum TaxID=2994102 RepID=A0ABT3SNX5_9MYCO|nr:alpha/beta hydrolase [Mycobacterium pinniadriaticum]MCX2934614.1 alpha/beta hydrolase [Mycobacterium pinniadriaticum]MCX2941037.1 alpha/beta hydrolase [Mycobacterium pinniadriaticum]
MEIRSGRAQVGQDLEICYEDIGNPGDPPVLLVMGLAAQLLLWRNGFCEKLVDQGYRVIRYDNRDVGLSSKLHGQRAGGSLLPNLVRSYLGRPSPSVYKLEDMADDAAALLDHLELERAHVVGASMGGMIAQIFAARHAHRTNALGIIFSSNNSALLPPPAPRALLSLITGPSPDSPREVIIENAIRVGKIIGSPGYPISDAQARADAIEAYERAHYPQGIARHFGAVLGSGSLKRYDRQISAPTVVIHGRADKLMRPSGGRSIASTIPNARLVLFDGMAHDLPEALWDDVVGELKTTFAEVS